MTNKLTMEEMEDVARECLAWFQPGNRISTRSLIEDAELALRQLLDEKKAQEKEPVLELEIAILKETGVSCWSVQSSLIQTSSPIVEPQGACKEITGTYRRIAGKSTQDEEPVVDIVWDGDVPQLADWPDEWDRVDADIEGINGTYRRIKKGGEK